MRSYPGGVRHDYKDSGHAPRASRFRTVDRRAIEPRSLNPRATSKMLYTLVYDVSDKPDQAAKDADIARRRGMFEGALQNMKKLAEGN